MEDVYWISEPSPGRLAIMPCPVGGSMLKDSIRNLRAEAVDMVVSLLPVREAALLDLLEEGAICSKQGIVFLSFPIEDRTVPESLEATAALVETLAASLHGGKSIAIHCRMGIGRSALIAACILVRNGISSDDAFARIQMARQCDVPDKPAQRAWVQDFERYLRPTSA